MFLVSFVKTKDMFMEKNKTCKKCFNIITNDQLVFVKAKRKNNLGDVCIKTHTKGICKSCYNKDSNRRNSKRKDIINEKRRFRLKNDSEFSQRIKNFKKISYKKNVTTAILANARRRAKILNLPFTITKEDLVIPDVCPILEIPILIGKQNYGNSPSLDKKIPELGYVKGNIRIISMKANLMKNNATLQELTKFSENILKYMKDDIVGT